MTNHYYSKTSTTPLQTQQIEHKIAGHLYKFKTASAVFSKDAVDFGSHFLIDYMLTEPLHNKDLLDVGCGYGPIGIVLAHQFSELNVNMVDVNQRALMIARQNIDSYHLSQRATVFASDCLQAVSGQYDYIVTNPPIRAGKAVVHQIFKDSYQHLKSGGQLVVVIQKKQGAPSAQRFIESVFGNCTIVKKRAGYYLLKAMK